VNDVGRMRETRTNDRCGGKHSIEIRNSKEFVIIVARKATKDISVRKRKMGIDVV
jgi:hypothetical protein